MIFTSNYTTPATIFYEDIENIKVSDQLPIIQKINESVDETWSTDTNFIRRKYLNNPQNYQVFKVAKITNEAIGYVIIREDYPIQNSSYLSFIALHPESRGKGVGSIFLNEAVNIIKQLGTTTLKIDCEEHNYSFYTKFADKQNLSYLTDRSSYQNGDIKLTMTIDLSKFDG